MASASKDVFASARHSRRRLRCSRTRSASCPGPHPPRLSPLVLPCSSESSSEWSAPFPRRHSKMPTFVFSKNSTSSFLTSLKTRACKTYSPSAPPVGNLADTSSQTNDGAVSSSPPAGLSHCCTPAVHQSFRPSPSLSPSLSSSLSRFPTASASSTLASLPFLVHSVSSRPFSLSRLASSIRETKQSVPSDAVDPNRSKSGRGRCACKHDASFWSGSAHDKRQVACLETGYLGTGQDPLEMHAGCIQTKSSFFLRCGSPTRCRSLPYDNSSAVSSAVSSCSRRLSSFSSDLVWPSPFALAPTLPLPSCVRTSAPSSVCSSSFSDSPPCSSFALRPCPSRAFSSRPSLPPMSTATPCSLSFGSLRFLASQSSASPSEGDRGRGDSAHRIAGDTRDNRQSQGNSPDAAEGGTASAQRVGEDCASPDEAQCPPVSAADWLGDSQAEVARRPDSVSSVMRSDSAWSPSSSALRCSSPSTSSSERLGSPSPLDSSTATRHDAELMPTSQYAPSLSLQPPGALDIHDEDIVAWYHLFDELQFTPHWKESTLAPHAGAPEHPHRHRWPSSAGAVVPHFGPPFYHTASPSHSPAHSFPSSFPASFASSGSSSASSSTAASSLSSASHPSSSSSLFPASSSFPVQVSPPSLRLPAHASQAEGAAVAAAAAAATARRMAAVAEALEWTEEMNRLFLREGKTRASQEIGRKTGFLTRCQDHPTRLSDERHTRHAPRHSASSSLVRRPPASASSLQPSRELYVNYQFPVLAHAALKGLYDRLFRSRKQTPSFSKQKRAGGLKTRGEPDRRRALHASPSTSAADPPLPSRSSEGSRRERPGTGRTVRSDSRCGVASRGSTDLIGRKSRKRRRTAWMSTAGVDVNLSVSQDATQDLDARSPDTICTDSVLASPQYVDRGVSGEKADESSLDSQAEREAAVSPGSRAEAAGTGRFSASETSASVRSDLPKEEQIAEDRIGGSRQREPVLSVANATLQVFSKGDRVAPATSINASEKGEVVGASKISSECVQRDRQVPVGSKPVRADMPGVEEHEGDSVREGFLGREAPLARQPTAMEVESLVYSMRADVEPHRISDERVGESRSRNRSSAEQPLQSNSGSASIIGKDPTASEGFGMYLETVVARNDPTESQAIKQDRVWTKSSSRGDALGSPLLEAPPVTREDVERAAATFQGPVVVEAPSPSFPPRKPPEIAPAFPFVAEEPLKPETVDGRRGNFLVLSKTAESLERSLMGRGVWTRLVCLASSLAGQIRFLLLPSASGPGTSQLRAPQSGASPFFQRIRGRAGKHFASLQARASEWCYQNGNVLVTTGSVLSLTGTVMADMRLLRGFNLLAGICFFSYNYTRRPSMTDAAAWNVVFFTLNFFMLYRYLTEHNEVGFTNDELDVFEKYFLPAGLSPRRFRTLLTIGRWETLPAGSELTRPGEPVKKLVFILRGRVDVYQHGDLLEHYTGTDGTPVIGLEAFLSYVSALRRLATLGEATKKSKLPPNLLGAGGSDAGSDSAAVGCPQSLDALERKSSGDSGQEMLKEARSEVQVPLRNSAVHHVRDETHADATLLSRELGGSGSPGGGWGAGSVEGTPETKGEIRDDRDDGEDSERAGSRLTPGWVGDVLLASDRTGKSQAGDPRVDTETPVTVAGAGASSCPRSSETTHAGVPVTCLPVSAREPNAPEGHGEKEEEEEEEGLLLPPLKQREGPASTETCTPEAAVNAATHTRASYFHEAAVVSEEEEDDEEDEAIWSRFLRSGRRRGPRGMLGEEEEARSTQEKEIAESLESGRASDKRAVCATDCDVLVFDIETAARFILDDPVKIGFPVLQGLASVLVERSYAQSLRLAINSYDSVVAGVLADGAVQTEERSFLEEWRARRGISDAQHIEALRRCGWSLEDFERGERHRPDAGVAGTVGRAVYSVLTLNFLRNGSHSRDGSAAGDTGEEAQKSLSSEGETREEKRTDGMGGTTALLGSRLEASRTGAEKKGEGTADVHAVSKQEGEANRNKNAEETIEVGGVASSLRCGAQPGKGTSPCEADRVGAESPRERKKISDCEAGNSSPTQSRLSKNSETFPTEPRPVDGSGGYTA
uniref:Cyclic nucleotide-binding domain-containing protein n=1 Tax=Toxoplasma gondii COUG TaxID=1074873 RepID=A0A2G8XX54_TOXGO|nr:hypothetical protein TGCOUG_203520 [Toxoplasma gondii COUG]